VHHPGWGTQHSALSTQHSLRFGLAAVKNVGRGAAQAIIDARAEKGSFMSLEDFCQKVEFREINRKVIEALIKCGAFDNSDDLGGRQAWAQLLDDGRMRRVDLVLCWKIDRPFRSLLHCLQTIEEFKHHGVGFAAVTQPIDTTHPAGVFMTQILAAAAEFERSLIRERVKEGMANAKRKGAKIGRPLASDRAHVAKHLPSVRDQVAAAGGEHVRQILHQHGVSADQLGLVADVGQGRGDVLSVNDIAAAVEPEHNLVIRHDLHRRVKYTRHG